MTMREKKRMRAMATIGPPMMPPPPGPLNPRGPVHADRYLRPGEHRELPFQNILATNHQARTLLKEREERQERTGEWEWTPEIDKARREAERSRVGRPGGSTFDGSNVVGKK